MSTWLEKIQSDFIITTGDKKQFTPLWVKTRKEVEYNVAQFNFPGVSGTLVKRGQPMGTRYQLEIFFQGANYLDTAKSFQNSAADPRAWVISHPMYGSIKVQPLSLLFDDSAFNTSKISGTVMETIADVNPTATVLPVDKIVNDKKDSDDAAANSFASVTPPVTAMLSNNSALYSEGVKIISNDTDSQSYLNAFNSANTAIENATNEPLLAIQKMQAFINAPASFTQTVGQRISTLINQYNILAKKVSNVSTLAEKSLFECNALSLLTSMFVASSTNIGTQYTTKASVLSVVNQLIGIYNGYVNQLNVITGVNGGNVVNWMPSAANQISLNQQVNFTVSNLFQIALNALQERILYLEEDSNVILLAHRFYGLLADDSTIQKFIDTNNIGLNELLEVEKGRLIVYYV